MAEMIISEVDHTIYGDTHLVLDRKLSSVCLFVFTSSLSVLVCNLKWFVV